MADLNAIRAGKAFVEAYLDDSKLRRGLKGIRAQFAAFGAGISSLGTKFSLLGAAIVTPLLATAKHFMTFGSELNHMSERTGIGTNALSEFGYAAELSGSSIEAVEVGVKKMQKAITAATEGPLKRLQGMSPERQFMEVADELNAIADPTMRAAKALEVFGKSGTALLPMMKDIRALRAEAVAVGRSMGPETAEAAEKLDKAWERLKLQAKSVALAVGGSLAPGLTTLANRFKDLLGPAIEWLSKHEALVQGALNLGVALAALGVTMKILGVSMTLLAAHPLMLSLIALGVVITALRGGFSDLLAETKKYDDAASRALERGDKQRVVMRGLASELEDLASQQQLGVDQQTRAKELIAQLTKAYGDLGLSVDEATGKIVGFDAAQTKLNNTMAEAAERELKAAIASADAERRRAEARWQEARDKSIVLAWMIGEIGGGPQAKLAAEEENMVKAAEKSQALRNRLRDLQRGNLGAVVPAGPGAAAEPGAAASGDKLAERLAHEANQRALEAIDNEERRAIAATHQKWNAELAAAVRTSEEKKAIAREEAEEIASIQKKYEKERDKELTENRRRVNDEIERALIDNTAEGSAKRLALLELERKQALRDAEGQGIQEEINRLFDIKRAGIDLESAKGPRTTVAGTFFASAVQGLGGGFQERIAKAVEAHREIGRQQLAEARRLGLEAEA